MGAAGDEPALSILIYMPARKPSYFSSKTKWSIEGETSHQITATPKVKSPAYSVHSLIRPGAPKTYD